jgi:hypothetical protein
VLFYLFGKFERLFNLIFQLPEVVISNLHAFFHDRCGVFRSLSIFAHSLDAFNFSCFSNYEPCLSCKAGNFTLVLLYSTLRGWFSSELLSEHAISSPFLLECPLAPFEVPPLVLDCILWDVDICNLLNRYNCKLDSREIVQNHLINAT